MKILLGILLLVNAALFMWGMGERQFLSDSSRASVEYHPELMVLASPLAATGSAIAKVVVNENGSVTTNSIDIGSTNAKNEDVTGNETAVLPAPEVPNVTVIKLTDVTLAGTSKTGKINLPPGICMLIGPFKTAIKRGRSGRKLNDMKIRYADRANPKGRVQGYRVYQGPFTNKADVSRAKRRLKKQGVKDLYLIKDADNERYISLGFFSSDSSANSFMDNLSKLRIKTKKRTEYGTSYYLLVERRDSIQQLLEKESLPIPSSVKKATMPCTTISLLRK